jgi:hypothetical protein
MAVYHKGKELFGPFHEGNVISNIYHMGKRYLQQWLSPTSIAAISLAFGEEAVQVIKLTNAYLKTIKSTDPQRALLLAGFINEDPLLVCSLVETSKTRWLVGDGKAWIDAGFYATQNTTAKAQAKLLGTSSASTYQAIFGARQGNKNRAFDICFIYPDEIFLEFSDTYLDLFTLGTLGTIANVELSSAGGWLNGIKVFNSSTKEFITPSKVAVFGRTDGNATNARPLNGAISYVEFGGDTKAHFIPMQRTDGTCGMLDIISGTFHPNANTAGSFTIQITDKEK